ncbi:MAG: hypothetical protein HC918_04570 [Oscillatoriales cyanobacterium SM2_1_8]|nr:hypothetical protein [Oscillatoriales cyanobacterium SM2_1_8]
MPGKRLTEEEKQEVARRYRSSAATASQLAQQFGVSASTIARFLQEGIPPAEYQVLVRQKQAKSKQAKGKRRGEESPVLPWLPTVDLEGELAGELAVDETVTVADASDLAMNLAVDEGMARGERTETLPPTEPESTNFSVEGVADLVGDEFDEEEEAEEDSEDEDLDGDEGTEFAYAGSSLEVLPLADLTLPSVCYITVDKFSEIVTRPLREFQEPGRSPAVDGDCPTMPLFAHHRHAKRFVQQNHRLIKLPAHLLALTQDKLREKGIARLWFEGKVYAL